MKFLVFALLLAFTVAAYGSEQTCKIMAKTINFFFGLSFNLLNFSFIVPLRLTISQISFQNISLNS